ncbi:MAG: Single-stranded-DNA-specific exonuclease, partial [Chloroflexota bacterium]
KFDIAYTLRATSFRGQRQVTLQFKEFRVTEERPVEVRESTIEIKDLRLNVSTFERLNVQTLIWAEGADRAKGKARFELTPADELAIYTTPPSPTELSRVLRTVKPKTVYLFAVSPVEDLTNPSGASKPEDFLSRLAGLCKFALNKKDGKTSIHEVAAAMASREIAIELGLEWLAAGGQLSVSIEADAVLLSKETQEKNPYLQAELFIALRGVLNETIAYRKYFATADNLSKFF